MTTMNHEDPADPSVHEPRVVAALARAGGTAITRFRKKPVVIEAVQFTRELRDAHLFDGAELPAGVQCRSSTIHRATRKVSCAEFCIETLEGRMEVSLGDWVITGVKGECYPCKPDIFDATYEPVEDGA